MYHDTLVSSNSHWLFNIDDSLTHFFSENLQINATKTMVIGKDIFKMIHWNAHEIISMILEFPWRYLRDAFLFNGNSSDF